MAVQKTRKTPVRVDSTGFDVVCSIGRVEFGNGNMDPVVAAMHLIGEHRAPGEYRFPHEDGGEWVVNVDILNIVESAPNEY